MQIKLKPSPLIKNIKQIYITDVGSLSYLFRQWVGLISLRKSQLVSDILNPIRRKTFCPELIEMRREGRLEKLNVKQFQMAATVIRDTEAEFSIPKLKIIRGPPGSGKSYTVKVIITHLLQVSSFVYLVMFLCV